MSSFELNFPADYMQDLFESDAGELAEEMLNEAAPILVSSTKSAISSVIQHSGDSELVNSITATKPKKTSDGTAYIVNVVPKGYSKTKTYFAKNGKGVHTTRKYKVSNALKLVWKEYGIAGRQPATPCLQKAINDAQNSVIAKMQEVYNRKVGSQ